MNIFDTYPTSDTDTEVEEELELVVQEHWEEGDHVVFLVSYQIWWELVQ